MEVTMVFVSTNDRMLLTLILSHIDDTLELQSDAVLLFLVDFLVHKSNNIVSYRVERVDYHSSKIPHEARLCLLPCCVDEDRLTCVAGLASCARHLIQHATPELPSLLGFRNICLKSPSEFSTWTKFCEITFPLAIKQLVNSVTLDQVELPVELLRLEKTLCDKPQVHNRQKIMKQAAKVMETVDRYVEGYSMLLSDLLIFATFHHALKELKCDEQFCTHLPTTMQWYWLMLQDLSVSYAVSQWDKNIISRRQSTTSQTKVKSLILPADDGSLSSIKDSTPKKLRKVTHQNCLTRLESVLDKVKHIQVATQQNKEPPSTMPWDKLPSAVDPSEGHLPLDRVQRKRQQIENMMDHVQHLISGGSDVIVDFCAGGGHLGIALAHCYPQCQVILVENKEESLSLARERVKLLNLTNVTCVQCNLNYFDGKFDIGVALHACGIATDLVLECCIRHKAHFVLSPCCYGSIHNTSEIHYPKSLTFQKAVNYEEYVLISGAADWTDWEFELTKGKLGKHCMNIMDTDRCMATTEKGYTAIINSMLPLECSPKNNIIIGTFVCCKCDLE